MAWAGRVVVWPIALLLGGLGAAYHAAALEHAGEAELRREAVRAELEPIRGALSRELFGAIQLTEGIAGLVAIEGGISEERFRAFAAELFRRSGLIRNVAVAQGDVVTFVHPAEGNERVVGFDYRTNPEQWPSVARMKEERRIVVAGPVALVQGGVGVIGRTPIYVGDPGDGPSSRRYWGLVSTVLELDGLLARTPLGAAADELVIALRGVDGTGDRGATFWGDAAVFAAAPVVVDVPLPSGSWQLAAAPRGGWPAFRAASSSTFVAGGLLAGVLSGLLLRALQAGEALRRARDELEARVAARTHELELAKDAAESADRLKSAFLAAMSHELRTPLNSIIGFSGILVEGLAGPLNEEQTKQLRMVCGSARHLLALINDVLDLSKIEAGQMRLERERFELSAAIHQAVGVVRPLAAERGLSLEVDLAPGVGAIVSDQRRVEQVLLNLLSNGIKFTAAGSVRVSAAPGGRGVTVTVTDTGVGIDPAAQDRLFRPFSQLDAGLNRRHEGTGLGLSICKRLVELLGGVIWVKSEPGRGSTFGFELPVEAEVTP
jgi:signal transduction histidine kinase